MLLRGSETIQKKEGWLLTSGSSLFTGNIRRFMCYNSKLENAIIDGKIMFSRRYSLVLLCEVA